MDELDHLRHPETGRLRRAGAARLRRVQHVDIGGDVERVPCQLGQEPPDHFDRMAIVGREEIRPALLELLAEPVRMPTW